MSHVQCDSFLPPVHSTLTIFNLRVIMMGISECIMIHTPENILNFIHFDLFLCVINSRVTDKAQRQTKG